MQSQPTTAILPATCAQAAEYFHLFVNRRAYVRQSHSPNKETGRFYYYKACERKSKQPLSIDIPTIQRHLEGRITTGMYAINPQTQTSKWIAIDADHDGARCDLITLQLGFYRDGIETLLEQSRRGGHLWVLLSEPLPARLCRHYVLNVAQRLGIALKRNTSDGIEVFPRQNELQSGEFGNAIRAPLGIHRATMNRYWFEDAEPNLEAQFRLLRQVKRVNRELLETLTAGMNPIPDRITKPVLLGPQDNRGGHQVFQILNHIPSAKRSGRNYVARCPACAGARRRPPKHPSSNLCGRTPDVPLLGRLHGTRDSRGPGQPDTQEACGIKKEETVSKSVNKVILLGHAGKDPQVHILPGGTLVNLSLATSERYKDSRGDWQERTEWHNLVGYQRTGEILRDYVRKGSRIYIEGTLRTRSWEDRESGQRRYRAEIVVTDVNLLSPAHSTSEASGSDLDVGSNGVASQEFSYEREIAAEEVPY